ncbi:MAG: zinc metallopeptidase, partial [Clostridiales bacterium]|nr:zinc metallopeptidase [Clostridiales bacterium]
MVELALIILGYLASLILGYKLKNTYRKYSGLDGSTGITGAEVAQRLLTSAGIRDVSVAPIPGFEDQYDAK